MDAFTGLYMSTARVDRVMEPTFRGDALAPASLQGAIQQQDQGCLGSQESRGEQLQKNSAEARTVTRPPD
jgi:hypothetical protein